MSETTLSSHSTFAFPENLLKFFQILRVSKKPPAKLPAVFTRIKHIRISSKGIPLPKEARESINNCNQIATVWMGKQFFKTQKIKTCKI